MKRRYSEILVFFLCLMVLACFFPKQLFQPNSTYFGFREDGLKNYYSLDYHIKYDSSSLHFGGMNYPFGEHIVFTDGQPLLSCTLWALKTPFPGIAGFTVGIMNILMLAGVCWAAVFLFKILRHFQVQFWLSIGAAVLLSLMAPQMLRLNLHYALAYSFFIPWIIFRMILFVENTSLKNSVAILGVMTLALGLHLYYLVIMGALLAAFYLVLLIHKAMPLKWPLVLGHFALQCLLPLGLFMVWMKVTDTVMDRPTAPYGMMEFRAMWEGVFLPLQLPAGDWLRSLIKVRLVSFEAISYVGFAGVFFFVFWLFSQFKRSGRARFHTIPVSIRALFLASLLVFLFAAIFPLLFEYSWIAGISGPLKQFRSMGRFSWVFFYGVNLYLILFLSRNLAVKSVSGKVLTIGVFSFMLAETIVFLTALSNNSGFERKSYILPSKEGIGTAVIFPAPYFHNGSENLGTATSELYLAERTMELSLQTGIPTFGVLLSRSSISQTLQQLELSMNLSGPLLATADQWLLLEDTAYSDTVRQVLSALGYNRRFQAPYFVSWIKTAAVRQALADRVARIRSSGLDGADTSAIIARHTMNNGDVPGLEGMGKRLSMDRSHILYNTSAYNGPDSVRFIFWLKADSDGLRGYNIVFKQDGTTSPEKHYRLEWCYSNVVNGFVRLEIAQKPLKGKACSLELHYDRPDMRPETVIDEWVVVEDGMSYCYMQGPFVFTSSLVYY